MLFVDREQIFDAPTLAIAVDLAAVNAAGIQDVADSTLRWWRSAIGRLVRWAGDVRLDELDAQTLFEWHREIAVSASAVTANSYLRAVAAVLARLVRAGILADSAARYVPSLPEPAADPQAVEEATYLAMRDAAECVRDRAMVDALWATGCRISGLLSMTVGRIEFWRVGDELRMAAFVIEKFSKSRYVYARTPQSDSVMAWLDVRPETGHDAVWLSVGTRARNKPLARAGAEHALRRLRERAGIARDEPANAHAFRHAFGIRMLDEGHDLAAVSAWLGHSDPAFTARVYVNRREAQLRRKYFE